MQTKRTDFLVVKSMRQFLAASILTMIVQQLNSTIDGIIVSRLIAPDALSAVNLCTPVTMLYMSLATLFGTGATIVATRAMGKCEYDKVNRNLSTALCSVIAVGILTGVCGWASLDSIARVICHVDRLMPYVNDYLFVSVTFCVIPMLTLMMNQMTNIDGRPKLVTYAVLISALSNIILDLLLISVFKMGIAGAAWATIVSSLIGAVFIAFYLFSKKSSYVLRPIRLFSIKSLGENMLQGTPLIVSNMIVMLLLFLLNNIIQNNMGADGVFALSVCMSLFSLGLMFSNGVGSSTMSIGGFLYGQKDYGGLHILVRKSVAIILSVIGILTVVLTFFPGVFCTLFCSRSSDQFMVVSNILRIFVWMLPPMLLSLFYASFYQCIEYLVLTPIIAFMMPAILVPTLYLMIRLVTGLAVWSAFPIAGALLLLFTYVITECFRKKKKADLRPISLLPAGNQQYTMDTSICVDSQSVNAALIDLNEYLSGLNLSSVLKHNVSICVEEIIVNVFQHARPNNGKRFLDLLIVYDKDRINVSVKDDGQPFDPIHHEERNVGLTLLNELCPNITYKYMYGQNMTFMTWNMY